MTGSRPVPIEFLQRQRDHVLAAVVQLDDEQLRRRVPPSGWCLGGLVRHLTIAIERYFFAHVVAGVPWSPPASGADWYVPDEPVPAASVIDEYVAECRRSDKILATVSLADPCGWHDPRWASWGWGVPDVEWVVLHAVEETAVHAGHADIVRELIDGRQWVVQS